MAWRVEYSPRATRAVRKLVKPVVRRIFDGLEQLATLEDPAAPGKAAMTGPVLGWGGSASALPGQIGTFA
ncbi:MAG TPA: hypothetical protein H9987_01890 [Candidatus Luteococcus avicola]|nr:hypothetical protein [Candidatus Luteococcus avicola]